jgi:LuxR family transcriptional regulator, maltose regulon positive regulatory protein
MSDKRDGGPAVDPWGVVPQRLHPPVLRRDVLVRSALVERLVSSDLRCVVVSAGAGYGKTTLLRQWSDAERRSVAWISLDPADNDPVVLLRHVVRTLGDAGQDVGKASELLASREPQLARDVVPALAAALFDPAQPFLLLMDDVHLLAGGASVEVLNQLLDMVPVGSTVALAGRYVPAVRLARRIVAGDALDLIQRDLAYTPDEAALVIHRSVPDLSSPATDEVIRRTECWPAGVHLAILALRDHPDPSAVLRGLLSEDRVVAEYLHDEVLDHASPDLREFLLRAAVLDRLTGSLCDEILERRDSRERLEELTASGNLFVVAVDAEPDTFRMHQLFANLLVGRLRDEDPAEEDRIRRRAAAWHDAHGEGDLAVRQARATGDLRFAADTVHRHLFVTVVRGEVATLDRWIGEFPPAFLHTDGILALCAAWAALSEGDRQALDRHLATARAHPVRGSLPDGTVDFAVGLAALEMTAAVEGVKASACSASIVRDAGPQGSPWWAMAGLIQGASLVAAGVAEPVEAFRSAEVDARGYPAVHAVTMAQLGVALIQAGDRAAGQAAVREAVEELWANGLEHFSMATMVHCADSYASALTGDADRSARAAADAVVLMEGATGVVLRSAILFRLVLVEAALRRREPAAAAALLNEAADLLPHEPDAVFLAAWAERLGGRLDDVRRRVGLADLSPAEGRVLDLLPTNLSLGEIGEKLFLSRNTVKSHTMSIYRKLAVSGRGDAVARARELGLLPRLDTR